MKSNKPANLTIKLNQNPNPNDCPLCGIKTNPNIGAEVFLADTETVVCIDCGSKEAPILAALLTFGDYSRLFDESGEPIGKRLETYFELSKLFCQAERAFGDKWAEAHNFSRSPMNAYQSFGVQKAEVRNG